jgi:hypothetical protein
VERRPRPCVDHTAAQPRMCRLNVLAAVALALGLALFCRPAWAENKAVETQARALQKKAMDQDFLNVDFAKAADKLNQAIAKCGTSNCSANLRALLRRDLATIHSAAGKKDEALKAMSDALKIDGSVQVDPNFKTKELDAVYAEAKAGVGAGGAPAAAGGGGGGTPAGDFTHTPPSEQAVRTPLPIYVEYSGTEAVTKVVVKYKAFGMTEFKTLELKKVGVGYGANIPCIDIQEGSIQYYVQGFTANNDPVATSGDRNNPYTVLITKTISGEAPHLPGQAALPQCPDSADCPPNFPGCKKGGSDADLKGEGADCVEDGQCKSGTCKDEKCTAPPAEASAAEELPFRRMWIGVSGSLDFQFLSTENSVCSLNPMTAAPVFGYACVVLGNDFPGNSAKLNASIPHGPSNPDTVNGGLSLGNIRILASFDYALNKNFLIGARAGYLLDGYPGSEVAKFPPIHLEARGTLVIGKDALVTKGFHPVLFLGTGVSQFSTSVPISVTKCTMVGGTMAGDPVAAVSAPMNTTVCPGSANKQTGTAYAWQVGGPVFVAPGGGVRWIIADRVAANLNVNLAMAFGGPGFLFVPSPELGLMVGF